MKVGWGYGGVPQKLNVRRNIKKGWYIYMDMSMLKYLLVKMVGISYAVVSFSIFGLLNAKIIDYIYLEEGLDHKNLSEMEINVELIKLTIYLALLCFIGRNIVERIPFVLDNIYGFKYLRLKEINNGAILLFFTMMFSSSFHKVIRRHRDLSEERVINSKRF